MTVEAATNLGNLDPTYPAGSDYRNELDNHVRMLKAVLKTVFPGAGGSGFTTTITATEAEINRLSGLSDNIMTLLNAKAPLASPTFTGTPAAPTATPGTNTTQLVNCAFMAANTGITGIQVFSASGTYTKPSTMMSHALVLVIGAGGGGGVSNTLGASGGAAGGWSLKRIPKASIGATEIVTVGAGGAGGTAPGPTDGSSGGSSSFGAHCSATGGAGGDGNGGDGALGGVGANGTINGNGSSSETSADFSNSSYGYHLTKGANSILSSGGISKYASAGGVGSMGSGGGAAGNSPAGSGGDGYCVVIEF